MTSPSFEMAWRYWRRTPWRNLMMAAVLAVGMVAYLVYNGYSTAMVLRSRGETQSLKLPAAAVIVLDRAGGAARVRGALEGARGVGAVVPARLDELLTNVGSLSLLRLGPAGQALLDGLGVNGARPAAPGQVLAPTLVTERLGGGSTLTVRGGGAAMTVSGTYDHFWDLGDPLIAIEARDPAAANVLFAFGPAGAGGEEVARAVGAALDAAADLPGYRLFTAGTPDEMVRRLGGEIYRPGGQAVALLFVVIAIGFWTLLLSAFLERRREVAVLKTVGLSSGEIARVFLGEAVLTGMAGAVLGLAAGPVATRLLSRALALPLAIRPGGLIAGVAYSLFVTLVAALYPLALAGRGTVTELLHGLPIRLFYQRVGGADESAAD
ncbi:MAG: ABC transporter permease [Bacillota bacterium]